uniref:DNA-directed RNA polymerase subunit beta n=1 Tax=Megaviridae environmental sample TaxID=1737588 RepID=A0A5J6VL65_9VIRU|nr:MAG: RNA polymerase Rpb2, domain 6 [Megaviridae environmental sample]
MSDEITQLELNKMIHLYFSQPNILYNHLFSSYHQFVEEIIPLSLEKSNNYFYENVTSEFIYLHGIKCTNIRIKPPVSNSDNEIMSPKIARTRHMNYFGTVYADVQQFVDKEDILSGDKIEQHVGPLETAVAIGNIPIMVKSKFCSTSIKKNLMGECKYDPGGHFIVNGSEKVVMSIEKMVDNKILIFGKNDDTFDMKKKYTAQINSKENDWTDNLQILTIKNKKNSAFTISTSQMSEIPIFLFFRALGLETDEDIINNIVYDSNDIDMINLLRISVQNSVDDNNEQILTKQQAIEYLITKLKRNKRINQSDEQIAYIQKKLLLEKILKVDILPHLGSDILKKIRFIGYMVHKLLRVILNRDSEDDRDALNNKRIETPGVLLSQLFKQNWKKMLNEIGKLFRKKNQSDVKPIHIVNHIKPTIIEQGIKTALATGIWGMNRTKKGVAQSFQRTSWILALSNLRRVMSPSLDSTTSGVISIRHINNIQLQFICPVETPEGQKIGIVKSLAMMSTVTTQNLSQKDIVLNLLKDKKDIHHPGDVSPLLLKKYGKIFLNGDWIGVTNNILDYYTFLKEKKYTKFIDRDTSISLNYKKKELYIYYDGGRLIRPLLNIKDNEIVLKKSMMKDIDNYINSINIVKGWEAILDKYPEMVVYEDIESSNYIMLSETLNSFKENRDNKNGKIEYNEFSKINRYGEYRYVNYTHLEFHRWTMLGLIASMIPFSNHNFATKNIVMFSQIKQSIGLYLSSYKDRMDISQVLYHPQVPLVTTEGMKYNHTMNLPIGENTVVAIMSYTGYNQEDSLIFSKNFIDRGGFRVDTLKKYFSEIQKNPSTSQDDIFTKPDRNKVTGMKQANYSKLNDKGYVEEETIINEDDVIIGKISPINPTGQNNKVYKDSSEIYKGTVEAVIDRVHTDIYNNDGYEQYNIRIRMERKPTMGDKFASRHGQKGTCGIILPQRDMPFTSEGIVPDIIMNPHGIPSRMTVAQLIECLAAKIGAIDGKFVDGTPFNDYNVKDLPKLLKKLGYSPYGTEKMYCGITGKEIESEIFIGPTYYTRLKHMVLDKVHSRPRGPRQALTRQPLEGRARDGGLKIGEMEKDSMVAHGISQFLKERMMETSDITTVHICDECGMFATKVMDKDYYMCSVCENYNKISAVNIPYACKLLFQELMSVNILPKINTKTDIYD